MEAILAPFGLRLSAGQLKQVREYVGILLQWNQKVNLTSLQDEREILRRHFGESMFAAHAVPISHGRLADVGSGAGFPGLALKIGCPALEAVLFEANARRAAFLREIKGALKLAGVEVVRDRFERGLASRGGFDFATARALGGVGRLLKLLAQSLTPGGKVVLWVGVEGAELLARQPGWVWRPAIPVPESARRVLLVGAPQR